MKEADVMIDERERRIAKVLRQLDLHATHAAALVYAQPKREHEALCRLLRAARVPRIDG
jgi:predicted transcriptional regulator